MEYCGPGAFLPVSVLLTTLSMMASLGRVRSLLVSWGQRARLIILPLTKT
jgi:hypothetical protein